MTNTIGDFWRMIWEQKSAAIVMLTELEEGGQVGIIGVFCTLLTTRIVPIISTV